MTTTLADTLFCYHCAALTRHTRYERHGGRVGYTCCTCRYGETLPGFTRFRADEKMPICACVHAQLRHKHADRGPQRR